MMAHFPDHLGQQNEARFRHRKLGFPQSRTTAAHARPIRRSRGYFDRRSDNLPEAQLRKAGAKGKNAAPCAAPGQKLAENGTSTAAMPGSAMIRARSGRPRRGRQTRPDHCVGDFSRRIAGEQSTRLTDGDGHIQNRDPGCARNSISSGVEVRPRISFRCG